MTGTLTFQELREANVKRLASSKYVLCEKNWTHAHWMQATLGELGELANILKKVDRGDFGLDSVIHEVANELADVQTYLDIMAYKLGVDLADATVNKFNTVSARIGSNVYIAQKAGPKAPKETYSNVAGYPDTDAMLDYLVSKVQHVELMKELLNYEYDKPVSQPVKVFVDPITGILRKAWEGEKINETCVLTLLAASPSGAPVDPVGMDQTKTQTACDPASVGGDRSVMARRGYVSRCTSGIDAKVTISGIATMERLPGESDTEYRTRNNINGQCNIPPYVPDFTSKAEIETGAPEEHAHEYPKALATLESMIQGFASQFKEHSGVKGSIIKGEFWLILGNGSMIPVKDYIYQEWDCNPEYAPVYYAER